jgi:hypothetical protein
VAGKRKQAPAGVRICYHPTALTEILRLDDQTQADVIAEVRVLNGMPLADLKHFLEPRSERKVVQRELSHSQGGLRIVFAWGKGALWVIGAFVKHNDEEGERRAKRILHRVNDVQTMAPC